MSPSLVREVTLGAAGVVLGTLVAVGGGTGALLHLEARRGLDRVLLAAAHEHAHPAVSEQWEVEHSRAPVEVRVADPGDPRLPPALRRAARGERPVFADDGDRRVLLLPVEIEDGDEERHAVVVATAPRVTWAGSVGPFAVAYGGVSALAAALAALVLGGLVRRAVAPLERARQASARVVRHGQGTRLPVEGPAEVRALLGDLNAVLERLDHAFLAQARFTGEAAHELRTPVTALLGEVDVALRRPRSAEAYRETLVRVRGDVGRLRDLVEGLIGLARLDSGAAAIGREPVRARELVDEALARDGGRLAAAGCPVRVHLGVDPELSVQRALVVAALGNLLRNAAAHAPGGAVRVSVEAAGAGVAFVVEDQGAGVPEAEREAVFDRFARRGASRRQDPGGLGLGLPLAREVARRHGGDCVLEDAAGGGCRAVLTIFQSASQGA